ncbi:MAG: hypothetical protein ACTHN5_12380 [Phycisphaerae bacterium]
MKRKRSYNLFKARLTVYVLGPIKERTKYKTNKLAYGEATITLPFVPYPGMFIRMHRRRKRGIGDSLNLRVRSVEWCLPEEHFECMVDEVLTDPCSHETYEVRGSARYEESFIEMQKTLRIFGFTVNDNSQPINRAVRYADGSWIDPAEERQHQLDVERWCAESRNALAEKEAARERRKKKLVAMKDTRQSRVAR